MTLRYQLCLTRYVALGLAIVELCESEAGSQLVSWSVSGKFQFFFLNSVATF